MEENPALELDEDRMDESGEEIKDEFAEKLKKNMKNPMAVKMNTRILM